MIFYRISELMLATLIQRYDKNISFLIQFKNARLTEILQTVRSHVNDFINILKPFLDNKMSIFEEYGAFNEKMANLLFETT